MLAGGDATSGSPEEAHCLLNWGVAISGRKRAAVDTLVALEARYRPQQTLALPNHLVMPGLINAQTHALGITARGQTLASDVFAPSMNPAAETGPLSIDDYTAAARLAFSEMLLVGTTHFADMSP